MRTSNKTSTIEKQVTSIETVQIKNEELVVISENKPLKKINVTVAYRNIDNIIIMQKDFVIAGNHYDLLMSESPNFAQGKPRNEYREDDLWHVIDLIDV